MVERGGMQQLLLAVMGVGYEIRSAVVDCLEMTILLANFVASLSARCYICHLNWQSEVAMMESNYSVGFETTVCNFATPSSLLGYSTMGNDVHAFPKAI